MLIPQKACHQCLLSSMSINICNRFYAKRANSVKMFTFRRGAKCCKNSPWIKCLWKQVFGRGTSMTSEVGAYESYVLNLIGLSLTSCCSYEWQQPTPDVCQRALQSLFTHKSTCRFIQRFGDQWPYCRARPSTVTARTSSLPYDELSSLPR